MNDRSPAGLRRSADGARRVHPLPRPAETVHRRAGRIAGDARPRWYGYEPRSARGLRRPASRPRGQLSCRRSHTRVDPAKARRGRCGCTARARCAWSRAAAHGATARPELDGSAALDARTLRPRPRRARGGSRSGSGLAGRRRFARPAGPLACGRHLPARRPARACGRADLHRYEFHGRGAAVSRAATARDHDADSVRDSLRLGFGRILDRDRGLRPPAAGWGPVRYFAHGRGRRTARRRCPRRDRHADPQ